MTPEQVEHWRKFFQKAARRAADAVEQAVMETFDAEMLKSLEEK